MVEPIPKFEKETGLCVTSATAQLDKDNKVSLGIITVLTHNVTIPKNTSNACITILTAKQADYLQPVNPELLTNFFNDNINSLISDTTTPPNMSSDEHRFPTPENCPNPEKLKRINKRIYEEIAKLKKKQE